MSVTERQHQYLDAMGIQVWSPRQGSASSSIELVATVAATPADSKADATSTVAAQKQYDPIESIKKQWQRLQTEVSQCMQCAELCQQRTQTVFGVGNQQAEWMIIGEAPGADEDRQGEPFVGRAGKLLDEMLLALGLRRQQVFIANVLKCRPPDNRDPHADEISHCHDYLQRQIALIQPRIILAVGRVAAQSLLESRAAVGKLRGKIHHYTCTRLGEPVPLVVSYHPAYLLRSPAEKQRAWQDLRLARQALAMEGSGTGIGAGLNSGPMQVNT